MTKKKDTKINKPAKAKKVEDEVSDSVELEETEESEEIDDDMPVKGKTKKTAHVDSHDLLPDTIEEEKMDDDASSVLETDEEDSDLPNLDDDDLNPFGDKWEE